MGAALCCAATPPTRPVAQPPRLPPLTYATLPDVSLRSTPERSLTPSAGSDELKVFRDLPHVLCVYERCATPRAFSVDTEASGECADAVTAALLEWIVRSRRPAGSRRPSLDEAAASPHRHETEIGCADIVFVAASRDGAAVRIDNYAVSTSENNADCARRTVAHLVDMLVRVRRHLGKRAPFRNYDFDELRVAAAVVATEGAAAAIAALDGFERDPDNFCEFVCAIDGRRRREEKVGKD